MILLFLGMISCGYQSRKSTIVTHPAEAKQDLEHEEKAAILFAVALESKAESATTAALAEEYRIEAKAQRSIAAEVAKFREMKTAEVDAERERLREEARIDRRELYLRWATIIGGIGTALGIAGCVFALVVGLPWKYAMAIPGAIMAGSWGFSIWFGVERWAVGLVGIGILLVIGIFIYKVITKLKASA